MWPNARRRAAAVAPGRGPCRLLAVGLFLLATGMAWAQERIVDAAVEVRVLEDGRVDVTERIEVRAEGQRVRHGIVRSLPLRDRDARVHPRVADIEVLQVLRDGEPEPWTERRVGDRLQIRIGDAGYLPTPSQPVYTLRWRSRRQVAFDPSGDAIGIEVVGPDLGVPVERASVVLSLPGPAPVDALQARGRTGPAGSGGRDYRVALSASGVARWTLTRALQPGEGFRIALGFPHGLVTPPSRQQRMAWWFADHAAVLLAFAGLAVLAGYCLLRWRRTARRRDAGLAPVRADPPPGISPAGLRYLRRMRYDERCFSADLLAAAVQRHVHVLREPGPAGAGWRLRRARDGGHTLPTMEQRALLATLLPPERQDVRIEAAGAGAIRQAQRAHASALRRRFQPAMFRASGGSVLIALGLAGAFSLAALAMSRGDVGPTLLALAPMLPMLLVFTLLVKAPTRDGRRLQAHVEGLRRYLAGAAPDPAPAIDAAHYQALLPYAIALDAEDAWTARFVAAVGAAAAGEAIRGFGWYQGVTVTDPRRFSRSVGVRLAARLAALARHRPRRRARGGAAQG